MTLEQTFEEEVKQFQQAYGHEAAYAMDVVACKLLSLYKSELIKKLGAHKELFEPAYEEADKAYVQALDRAINLIREEEK